MLSTANGTVSARTQEFEYSGLSARNPERAKWFEEWLSVTQFNEGATRLIWGGNEPPSPRPPGASWLGIIEKRISESSTPDPNQARSGRWLPQATAIAALKFFKATSDLLPGEPYIYGSPMGDLVAEFDGEKGTLTSVIGPNITLLFAIIGGTPIKRAVPRESSEGKLRSELMQLAESLRTGKHGALETEHR